VKFTFGIVTKSENNFGINDPSSADKTNITKLIESINDLKIPEYEIIVVGGENIYNQENITHFEFDDNINPLWITAKKNIIIENAKYENIVFTHDYIKFSDDWYKGFLKFGEDWDICMNVILNSDGSRFRDWCAWDDPDLCIIGDNIKIKNDKIVGGMDHRIVLVPYDYKKTNHMYISGTYWVAKKKVMLEEPLDKNRWGWGQQEDVEWSQRVRDKYRYVMNPYSIVQSLKEKQLQAEVL
jgi:hypothetical protein